MPSMRGMLMSHSNTSTYTGEGGLAPGEQGDETAQVWEHVKALRKRVAGFN